MNLCEARDNHIRTHIAVKDAKIKSIQGELQESKDMQMMMEDKIYMLSIDNKNRQEDKEQLIMILPIIYKAIKGQAVGPQLKQQINNIENEGLKNKVVKMLQQYKIKGI